MWCLFRTGSDYCRWGKHSPDENPLHSFIHSFANRSRSFLFSLFRVGILSSSALSLLSFFRLKSFRLLFFSAHAHVTVDGVVEKCYRRRPYLCQGFTTPSKFAYWLPCTRYTFGFYSTYCELYLITIMLSLEASLNRLADSLQVRIRAIRSLPLFLNVQLLTLRFALGLGDVGAGQPKRR